MQILYHDTNLAVIIKPVGLDSESAVPAEIKKDKAYHWYNLMTVTLPPADEKVQLTCHDGWVIDFNNLLNELRKQGKAGDRYRMHANMKFENKSVLLDSIVFVKLGNNGK